MGKASSAKKVARAARAGGSRRPGQRRQIGFPLIILFVLGLGVFLVLFARSSRDANARPLSQANAEFDHWHAALGVYDCDTWVYDGSPEGGAYFVDALQDPAGIHTHEDGVIHIHPFLDSAGGRNARMRFFFADVNIQISDDDVIFPDGTEWKEGEKKCGTGDDAQDGQIVIARWNSAQQAADGERPSEIITEDFDDIRFREDREYFTLGFLTDEQLEDIPVRPDILATLNNLSDVPPEENIDAPSGSTTSTTAGEDQESDPDGSTTTTAGDGATTSTTAADTSSTTATTAAG